MSKPFIYLASPYDHYDILIKEQRFQQAAIATAQLITNGNIVYSPIVHSHPVITYGNAPTDIDFWIEFDTFYLDRCDLLCVLLLHDWEKSSGIKLEIEIAKKLQKPIIYLPYSETNNELLSKDTNSNTSS